MKRRLSYKHRRWVEAYVFSAPFLVGMVLFFAYPLVTSVRLSLSRLVKIAGWQMEWLIAQRGQGEIRDAVAAERAAWKVDGRNA